MAQKGEPMLGDTFNNLWDTSTNQWVWVVAAGCLVILLGAFAAYKVYKTKPNDAVQSDQDGWSPTGRIDFSNSQSMGNFTLQAEDTRIVGSIAGVERREIRWRNATLEEAKTVVVAYHAQRNLAMAANFIVSSSRRVSDIGNGDQKPQLGKSDPPEGTPAR